MSPDKRTLTSVTNRKGLVLMGLVAICVGYFVHVLSFNFISDDSFIALRYVRNLVDGHGLVFNPGERVEGFTSPLWIMMLAGLGYVGIDLLTAARFLGVLAGLVTMIVAYELAASFDDNNREPSVWALLAPLIIAANGSFACWAASGLETPLFTALVASSLLSVIRDRYWLSAWLAAGAVLTRPEGIIVLVAVGAFYVITSTNRRSSRHWLGWWLFCGGTLVALLLARYIYYGDLLPNTYYAKTGGGWAQIERGFRYMIEYAADHEGLLVMIVPLLVFLVRKQAKLCLISIAVTLYWAATIWVGGDGLPLYRFALVPLVLLAVLQAILFQQAYNLFVERYPQRTGAGWMVLPVAVGILIFVHFTIPINGGRYGLYAYQKEYEIPVWSQVGRWFRDNADPGESLSAMPIGALSYYSGLIAYDMLGLTDRHIARVDVPEMGSGWAGHEKQDAQYILDRRPTYLLLGNIDVTQQPRDVKQVPFIPFSNQNIFNRERGFYINKRLLQMYRPRSVEVEKGLYLNFYELKEELRDRASN